MDDQTPPWPDSWRNATKTERARIIAILRTPSDQLIRAGGTAIAAANGHPEFTPWPNEKRDAVAVLNAAADWLEKNSDA